jgi:hypothetical protein
MWFTKTQTETVEPEIQQTPLEQLEQLRQRRRQAKAEYDQNWKALHQYLNTHFPLRQFFALNDKLFVPVNFLARVPAEQRALETKVARSRARWSTLQKQESDLEFAFGLKR